MKRDECDFIVRDHIEKGGEIEIQVEKILSNSSLIHSYIENNLSLQDDIEFFLQKIRKYKDGKDKFRKFILLNSNKLLLKGSKKKNLEKVRNLISGINEVKNLIEKINFSDGKKFSIQEENELLNRGKEIIKNLKFNFNKTAKQGLVVINLLERELLNHNSKSSEKIIDEFAKLFTNMMKSRIRCNYIDIDIDIDNDKHGENKKLNFVNENYIQEKFNYVSILFKIREKLEIEKENENATYITFIEKFNILKIEENSKFFENLLFLNTYDELTLSEEFKKIREILNVYFKQEKYGSTTNIIEEEILQILNNLITGPFSKIKKSLNDVINYFYEILSQSVNKLKVNEKCIKNNEKGKLLLMLVSKSFLVINNNFEIFIKFIIDHYLILRSNSSTSTSTSTSNECNQILLNFSSELKKFYLKEMNKIIEPILDNIFSNSINQLDIDNFSSLTEEIKIVLKNYFSNFNTDSNSMFLKLQNEFVFQFFEEKGEYIREILDREDWNLIPNVNKFFQLKIKFLLKTNFIDLKFKDKTMLINLIANSLNEEIITEEKSTQVQDPPQTNPFLEIKDLKYKTTISTLELINFIFDFIKLVSHFDISLCETTVYQFVKILKFFMTFCKETIIEGEGVKRGKLKSISQKEISMLCANINIIEGILFEIIKNFSSEYLDEQQEILIPSLNEILNYARKLHIYCRDKINELFQFT
jgi:hypothetical protein